MSTHRIGTNIELKNFSIGLPKNVTYGKDKVMVSGICKQTIDEAFLAKDGFKLLTCAITEVLTVQSAFYPYEYYSLCEQEFSTKLPPSTFGENLTVQNMLENDVYIGNIYRIGDAVVQVTQGRIPCSTITKRVGIPLLLKRMIETGFTGYLCRVLEEGIVRKNSSITLLESHPKQVSILYANDIYFRHPKDVGGMKKILEVDELAVEWHELLTKRLEKVENPV